MSTVSKSIPVLRSVTTRRTPGNRSRRQSRAGWHRPPRKRPQRRRIGRALTSAARPVTSVNRRSWAGGFGGSRGGASRIRFPWRLQRFAGEADTLAENMPAVDTAAVEVTVVADTAAGAHCSGGRHRSSPNRKPRENVWRRPLCPIARAGTCQDAGSATANLRDRIIVFSGHVHNYERHEHGGVTYFVTGGAGAHAYPIEHARDDPFQSTEMTNTTCR
jgi:hypothetical protein